MTLVLTNEQHLAIGTSRSEEPIQVIDPATQAKYVLLPEGIYRRLQEGIMEADFEPSDAYAAIDELASKEGWNDPAMDAYDALDPRRVP